MIRLLGHLRVGLWATATMLVALYLFFFVVGSVSPARAAGVSLVAILVATAITLRNLRLAGELASRGGNPLARRERNRDRERRGF